MITSWTDIFVPLSSLPCFGPRFTQPEKRMLDRHFPSQEAPTHGGSHVTQSGDTNTWAFFRHERPREPVALMAQDQRMGLELEFLCPPIISKSYPVHSSKSSKRQAEATSGARLTRSLSLFPWDCGSWLQKWQSILSPNSGFHFNFLFILSVFPEETIQLFISWFQPIS